MLVHEEEEVIFHRPLQPEWGCFAPPLMLDDVLLKYEAGFQECGQDSVRYWDVVLVSPSVAYEDCTIPVWFEKDLLGFTKSFLVILLL